MPPASGLVATCLLNLQSAMRAFLGERPARTELADFARVEPSGVARFEKDREQKLTFKCHRV